MYQCNKCGKTIRYIPINYMTSVKCDDEEFVFYTITGRKQKGYKLHDCEKKNGNNNDREQRTND